MQETELIGWKAVADALGVGVRTAMRYEHKIGLPVYRVGPGRCLVRARREQLVGWMALRHDLLKGA